MITTTFSEFQCSLQDSARRYALLKLIPGSTQCPNPNRYDRKTKGADSPMPSDYAIRLPSGQVLHDDQLKDLCEEYRQQSNVLVSLTIDGTTIKRPGLIISECAYQGVVILVFRPTRLIPHSLVTIGMDNGNPALAKDGTQWQWDLIGTCAHNA